MFLPGFSLFRRILTLIALALLVGSCTVVVDEGPRPAPPRPRPPAMCTMEYAPVCAARGPNRQTFANSCRADVAGYRILHRGQCRGDSQWGGGSPRPVACTREYRPVCARRGSTIRTFSNACEARAADFRIIGNGRC